MPRPLPPLNSIRAFETAARHLNFSRAAEELGVTQGAISKQILLLESYIGHKLFERLPGGLELTDEGNRLRINISPVFRTLEENFERYSRRPPRSNVVRISTLGSFAAEFLVPRLDRFEEALPDITLEILTSNRLVDFAREEIDFAVRFGAGGWSDVVAKELVKGVLVPVCSPALLARNPGGVKALIENERRIQVFTNNEWNALAHEHNIDLSASTPAPCPFIIEDFFVAISAAVAGQGLALLPEILTRYYVEKGKLAIFDDARMPTKQTYYITHAPNADRKPNVKQVIDWLRAEVNSAVAT